MDAETEREQLVAALKARGVAYLTPSDARGETLTDEALLARLAAHPDARLRSALTALFLRQPALASLVTVVLGQLTAAAQVELQARYMAAVYLQRFWRTRLEIYNLCTAVLPDLFSSALGLPPAEERFGKPGLHELAAWHQRQSPVAYNRGVEYELVIEHLVASARMAASDA